MYISLMKRMFKMYGLKLQFMLKKKSGVQRVKSPLPFYWGVISLDNIMVCKGRYSKVDAAIEL